MFPWIADESEIKTDMIFDFTLFNDADLQRFITLLEDNDFNILSQTMMNVCMSMFFWVAILVAYAARDAVYVMWTTYTSNPNILFIIMLLFYQWANALMAEPKIKSFI